MIGGGSDGADADAMSFVPNWGACLRAHPDVNEFLANCKSSSAPFAFVYTRGFPPGADFAILRIRYGDRLEVGVWNGGRSGIVTRIDCSTLGAHVSAPFSEVLEPGELKDLTVGIVPRPGLTLACKVTGTDLDGTPEADTADNVRSRVF